MWVTALTVQTVERCLGLGLTGVPLLAADEPIAFDRRDPGSILFRRLKLGVAEWFRADIKRQSWNGMRTHIMQG